MSQGFKTLQTAARSCDRRECLLEQETIESRDRPDMKPRPVTTNASPEKAEVYVKSPGKIGSSAPISTLVGDRSSDLEIKDAEYIVCIQLHASA